jgi:hypothetical protein
MPTPERGPSQPITDRHKLFTERVNTYPDEVQEIVAGVSSMMLEPDISDRFRNSNTEIQGLKDKLVGHGLSAVEVPVVLDYFELPDPDAKPKGEIQ